LIDHTLRDADAAYFAWLADIIFFDIITAIIDIYAIIFDDTTLLPDCWSFSHIAFTHWYYFEPITPLIITLLLHYWFSYAIITLSADIFRY
jgi:hypothetical protein